MSESQLYSPQPLRGDIQLPSPEDDLQSLINCFSPFYTRIRLVECIAVLCGINMNPDVVHLGGFVKGEQEFEKYKI